MSLVLCDWYEQQPSGIWLDRYEAPLGVVLVERSPLGDALAEERGRVEWVRFGWFGEQPQPKEWRAWVQKGQR